MAAGRKIEDERDARECLAAVAGSGLEAREWARRHGVDGRSLNVWRVNLGRRGMKTTRSSKPRGLVELLPTPNVCAVSPSAARYALDVDGVRIEFGDDFEESTLRRVLAVLRAC
jgi:hypothetical protein